MSKSWFAIIFLSFITPFPALAADVEPSIKNDYMVAYETKGKFEEVRDAVKMAIANQGLVINNISYIGKMLTRTGKDLGTKKQVYEDAQSLEFCSATISRATMEADIHNIIFCPYIISVYATPDKPERIYISYRRPQPVGSEASKASLKEVEKLLERIIQEALLW